jgi:tetratricopeptide (TPR) repeat protein
MQRITKHWPTVVVVAVLIPGTLAIFWPLTGYRYIMFDDWEYVVQNPMVQGGLHCAGLKWAFTNYYASNWHPITWLSHMLDVQLFGSKPGVYHLINIVLHAVNSLLVFFFFRQLTGALWRSAFVAALFAFHPMHVESVAWISERKDVLSGLFFFLTLLAYAQYAKAKACVPQQKPATKGPRPKAEVSDSVRQPPISPSAFYALSLVFFALGLMGKPMLVTAPCVLLLLDYWPLGRVFSNPTAAHSRTSVLRLLLEKLPFFALSTVSSVLTFFAQRSGGAVETLEHVTFGARLSNALVAYLLYLQKLFWPSKLSILYLRPEEWPVELVGLAIVVLLGVTALAFFFARKFPYLLVGWLWFLGTLVPVIGLVQVGNQIMADRYTYLPYIGLFIALGWGASEITARFRISSKFVAFVAAVAVGIFGVLQRQQVRFWEDTETLFNRAIAVTNNNWMAHNILGAFFSAGERFNEAKLHLQEALRIHPGYADAYNNLGIVLTFSEDVDAAVPCFREAIRLNPARARVYAGLGFAFDELNQPEKSISFYRVRVRLEPDDVGALNNLAWVLATSASEHLRNGTEAVRLAEHACELTHYKQPMLIGTLAAAYAEVGRFDDAIETGQKAIELATSTGRTDLVNKNQQLVELYRAGKPYRQ